VTSSAMEWWKRSRCGGGDGSGRSGAAMRTVGVAGGFEEKETATLDGGCCWRWKVAVDGGRDAAELRKKMNSGGL